MEEQVEDPINHPGMQGSNIINNSQLQGGRMAQDLPLYDESAQTPDLRN